MIEERHIVSRLGTTYYWIEPSARPDSRNLVFLPGLTADHRLFRSQISHFAGRHTVLVWDAPGHGMSRPYQDYSYSNLARELKTILDQEGLEQVVLIGQSAGGFTAQSFIGLYPDRVQGFMGIGTCSFDPRYYSRSDLFWLQQLEWMARLFPDRFLRSSMSKACASTDHGRENMLQMLSSYGKKELCHLMYVGEAGFLPEIRELNIPCPVCLVVGENDRIGKVMQYSRQWHEHTGYPLHIIPNAAHNANDDRPEAVNAILSEFLDTLA